MTKINTAVKQIKQAIDDLPLKDRTRLIQTLLKSTWKIRLEKLRSRIRNRNKKHPLSEAELNQIVEEAREEYHAQNRN